MICYEEPEGLEESEEPEELEGLSDLCSHSGSLSVIRTMRMCLQQNEVWIHLLSLVQQQKVHEHQRFNKMLKTQTPAHLSTISSLVFPCFINVRTSVMKRAAVSFSLYLAPLSSSRLFTARDVD